MSSDIDSVNIKDFAVPDDAYHHGNLREALLEKAIDVLSEQGTEALSLRALARDLGVSHSAPLRHFATKADLLCAVAETGVAQLIEKTERDTNAETARERLLQMALAYVAWAQENPAFHRVLRNPDVLRHGSVALTEQLACFAARQRAEIGQAQVEGWRTAENQDTLMIHLMSLTSGTAIVATDPAYKGPLGEQINSDAITASLKLFLA